MARIVVINEVNPRELGTVLDKVLGSKPCPMEGLNLGIEAITVKQGDMASFLKSIGQVNTANDLADFLKKEPKQNPSEKNKGGKV